jgi:hypothetical protein
MSRIWTALLVALVLSLVASSAFAGGDKNRGDKGKGTVIQHQVNK